jgi:hypothetical protein
MSGTFIAPWAEPFNPDLGLWTSTQPGHTRPVAMLPQNHSGVAAACRLVIAGQLGILDQLPASLILRSLRGMQTFDGGPRHGCFRWFAEEPAPVDTNAAFFTGLNLVVLSAAYRDQLAAGDLAVLDVMLADLHHWFLRQCHDAELHYPNKFLGDLVCAWLLHEQVGGSDDERISLIEALREAALYWRDQHWGWGEHLSDAYASVMLNELSSLLLLSNSLPTEIRQLYTDLFRELVALDDAYAGAPRVPAIRSYAFTARPPAVSYRSGIRLWASWEEVFASQYHHFQFGHLFHQRGWQDLAGPQQSVASNLQVPCFGGAYATAWISPKARLGTMSRYPIMPRTDHSNWGLSWQSLPVVLAAGAEGWSFLRWHTREGGVDRYHPAQDKRLAYLSNALTDAVSPPIVGQTFSLQDGPDAVVLRIMPVIARSWETVADQFVILGSEWTVRCEERQDDAFRLVLALGENVLTLFFHSLGRDVQPVLHRTETGWLWEVSSTQEALQGVEMLPFLWTIAWGRDVPFGPQAEPFTRPGYSVRVPKSFWRVPWLLHQDQRSVEIDLGAPEPLVLVPAFPA